MTLVFNIILYSNGRRKHQSTVYTNNKHKPSVNLLKSNDFEGRVRLE